MWTTKVAGNNNAFVYVYVVGCLNGGGQLRPEGEESARELFSRVETVYQSVPVRSPWDSELVSHLYVDWLGGADSEAVRQRLHTQYHAVPKMTSALSLKW